jgi:hypothetical protein
VRVAAGDAELIDCAVAARIAFTRTGETEGIGDAGSVRAGGGIAEARRATEVTGGPVGHGRLFARAVYWIADIGRTVIGVVAVPRLGALNPRAL